uniref:PKD/REJ-like domain-containing protein n=1 Tax=Octopus bimaculoides TaxID=37653 RepID=A0A0L8H652_OCTBM
MSQPNPCYIKGILFLDLPNITSSELELAADSLILSYTYNFTLTMTKGQRKSSASVQIVTVPDPPPQVLFEPAPTKVLTSHSLKLTVYITSTTNFSIEWRVDNSNLSDYGYFDINNPDNFVERTPKTEVRQNYFFSYIIIKSNVLQAGMKYKISVIASSSASSVPGMGAIEFKVPAGVTSCLLQVPMQYKYLESIKISVSECETDSNAYPFQYQFFSNAPDGQKTHLNVRSTQPSVTVSGPRTAGKDTMKFSVEVCNSYGMCQTYISDDVNVTVIDNAELQQRKTEILENVDDLLKTQNYFDALLSLVGILGIQDNARKKRSAEQEITMSQDVIKAIDAWEMTVLKPLSTEETIILSSTIVKLDDEQYNDVFLKKFITNLDSLIKSFKLNQQSMPNSIFTSSVNKALLAASRNCSSELSQNILNSIFEFAGSKTSPKNLKSTHLNMFTTTSMLNQPLTSTQTEKVTFTPGKTLEKRYFDWSCSDSVKCQGAVAQISQIVNGTSVFPLNDTKTEVASDVIDLSLYNPNSGLLEKVSNLDIPVVFEIQLDEISANKIYKCFTWDSGKSTWEDLDAAKTNQSSAKVQCQTNHLTKFLVGQQSKISQGSSGHKSSAIRPSLCVSQFILYLYCAIIYPWRLVHQT